MTCYVCRNSKYVNMSLVTLPVPFKNVKKTVLLTKFLSSRSAEINYEYDFDDSAFVFHNWWEMYHLLESNSASLQELYCHFMFGWSHKSALHDPRWTLLPFSCTWQCNLVPSPWLTHLPGIASLNNWMSFWPRVLHVYNTSASIWKLFSFKAVGLGVPLSCLEGHTYV